MIDLYFWTTPNGYKVLQFLEETGMDYRLLPVNLNEGEQFTPEFLKVSPNNKMPAIVDHAPANGGDPIALFESGAILLYLAEKTNRFIPAAVAERANVLQWLFWQMGGLGPFAGQNLHFSNAAPEKLPYAINRYVDETARLFSVMNTQLADHDYLAGDYSIADMASYPWVKLHEALQQDLDDYPHLQRWFEQLSQRSAIRRAYEKGKAVRNMPSLPVVLKGDAADSSVESIAV